VTLPLIFHPSVRGEVDDGYRWYEERQIGLGREFLDELARVLAEIQLNPSRFGFADVNIREGQLNRFPYAIYYRVLRDRIRVLAVFHASRDPAGWRSRS
jgi:plasmid stabilization system protein ParE